MKIRHLIMLLLFLSGLAAVGYETAFAMFASHASNSGNSFTSSSQFPSTAPLTSAALKINEFLPNPATVFVDE